MRHAEQAARFAIEVARLLRAERLRQKLTTRELARRAGLSQPSVSYIERALRVPSLETAYRLTAALDIDLAQLINRAAGLVRRRNG